MAAIQTPHVIYTVTPVEKLCSLVLTSLHSEIRPILDRSKCVSSTATVLAADRFRRIGFPALYTMQRNRHLYSLVIVPKPTKFYPDTEGVQDQLAALPATAGVYLILVPGAPGHVSWSSNLRRRLGRLLASSYTAKTSVLQRMRENSSSIEYWPTGSKLESSLLLYQLGKQFFPDDYLFRLHLRLPWFVALMQESYPRVVTLSRASGKAQPILGPFVDRDAAVRYAEAVSNLFQLRRCSEVLQPDPHHPGCIYGEMNQCLRPCQCAVSAAEYRSETTRVSEFLLSNGKSAIASLSAARERAAEDMDFEAAGALHKRIEKLAAAAGERPAIVGDISTFSGLALTRGVERRMYRLWPMLNGCWQAPCDLDFTQRDSQTKSLDSHVRELLARSFLTPRTDGNPVEELALFSRWYYSSYREGEWFPFRNLSDLNYRKLVRAISNLVRTDTHGFSV